MKVALQHTLAILDFRCAWNFGNAFQNGFQLHVLRAKFQRLQAFTSIQTRAAVRSNRSDGAAQDTWPPVEDPERRRRRFGESVESMKRAARRGRKEAGKGKPPPKPRAPDNGRLVADLIPVAHRTLEARAQMQQGVERLLELIPAHACCECLELSVGPTGHPFPTCRGKDSYHRKNRHQWAPATCRDLLLEPESYHLENRTLPAIYHQTRFHFQRVPAILELCIQGGVDVEGMPVWRKAEDRGGGAGGCGVGGGDEGRKAREDKEEMKRERREMLRGVMGRKDVRDKDRDRDRDRDGVEGERGVIEECHVSAAGAGSGEVDAVESRNGKGTDNDHTNPEWLRERESEVRPESSSERGDSEPSISEEEGRGVEEEEEVLPSISEDGDVRRVAQRTLDGWVEMREGVRKMMKKYGVKTCGYCSEVHVGPIGHKVRLCSDYKQQWRAGMHGWHDAHVDDVILPRYVWHRCDPTVPFHPRLREYYGMLPAIVEMCVQGGAEAPEEFEKMRRTDVVLPDIEELRVVF